MKKEIFLLNMVLLSLAIMFESCIVMRENILKCEPQILGNNKISDKLSNLNYTYYVYNPNRNSKLVYNKRHFFINFNSGDSVQINKDNIILFLNGKRKKIRGFHRTTDGLSFKIRKYGKFKNDTICLHLNSANMGTLINSRIMFNRDICIDYIWRNWDYISKDDWNKSNGKIHQ